MRQLINEKNEDQEEGDGEGIEGRRRRLEEGTGLGRNIAEDKWEKQITAATATTTTEKSTTDDGISDS